MEKNLIKEINKECLKFEADQGIFFQPNHIPVDIKEFVIYSRYIRGGHCGGNCYGDDAKYFYNEKPKDFMKILDIVLEKIYPQISYLQYNQIKELIYDNTETEREYYGNSADYYVEYIILSELEKLVSKWKKTKK